MVQFTITVARVMALALATEKATTSFTLMAVVHPVSVADCAS